MSEPLIPPALLLSFKTRLVETVHDPMIFEDLLADFASVDTVVAPLIAQALRKLVQLNVLEAMGPPSRLYLALRNKEGWQSRVNEVFGYTAQGKRPSPLAPIPTIPSFTQAVKDPIYVEYSCFECHQQLRKYSTFDTCWRCEALKDKAIRETQRAAFETVYYSCISCKRARTKCAGTAKLSKCKCAYGAPTPFLVDGFSKEHFRTILAQQNRKHDEEFEKRRSAEKYPNSTRIYSLGEGSDPYFADCHVNSESTKFFYQCLCLECQDQSFTGHKFRRVLYLEDIWELESSVGITRQDKRMIAASRYGGFASTNFHYPGKGVGMAQRYA